jgi:hypothetical protein
VPEDDALALALHRRAAEQGHLALILWGGNKEVADGPSAIEHLPLSAVKTRPQSAARHSNTTSTPLLGISVV